MEPTQYSATMDLFPQQGPEHNKLHAFYENLREGSLATTKCTRCGWLGWPPRTVCPECMSDRLDWIPLPADGTIEVFTVEEIGVPVGFEKPLVHALVHLDGVGLRLFSRIVRADLKTLAEGARVRLAVLDVPGGRVSFAFQPSEI